MPAVDVSALLFASAAALLACAAGWRARRGDARLGEAQLALDRCARHDALTGLPNRLHFEQRLAAAVIRAGDQPARRLAVLFIDLDGFRPVNDSLGYAAGDQLLCVAAVRLASLAADSDLVARIGGDEFVMLLERDGSVPAAVAMAERAVQALGRPFDIGGHEVGISASVGIVVYPDEGQAERLLVHADAAMDAAKRAGGANFALYRPHMDADALDQMALQNDLRQALARGELQLHYQPKVDAASGALVGVEALLRWHHAERGWVSPARFVPVAERFGLIGAVGDWVIDEACRQMAEWSRQGLDISVAVNVSVHQLRHGSLAARLEAAFRRHGVAPSRLLCEVTESAAMEDLRTSQAVFDAMLRIGVYLSIDDFGTGYSSLAYLRRLPARQLKIDRSFVNDLEDSADARAVVHAVLELAHALSLRVVAEGVETEAQRDILHRLGCDELQGWLFARPMPPADLPAWAAARAAISVS